MIPEIALVTFYIVMASFAVAMRKEAREEVRNEDFYEDAEGWEKDGVGQWK